MNKKVFLGTLLASSALLGIATSANAATSNIKSESKKITVTSTKAKLYKDSKLKESSTPKQGTVYQVDGYRDINGKKYYRVYNTNSKNKKTYKGYLKSTDAKDLKAVKENVDVTYKNADYTRWGNLYYTAKEGKTGNRLMYHAERSYTLGNGDKYYSLYRTENDGSKKWYGYVNVKGLQEVKATSYNKNVRIKTSSAYTKWRNFYFNKSEAKGTTKLGQVYTAKRYYVLGNGDKYYSMYQLSKNGDLTWAGYVNAKGAENMKATASVQVMEVTKDNENTYSASAKKGTTKGLKGKQVVAKRYYIGENNKKYYSIYDQNDNWLGYLTQDALKPVTVNKDALNKTIEAAKKVESVKADITNAGNLKDAYNNATSIANSKTAVQSQVDAANKELNQALDNVEISTKTAEEAIQKAKDILAKAQASTDSKEAAQKAIDEAEKEVKDNKLPNYEDIKNIPNKLIEAMKGLQPHATSSDINSLNSAIKDAEEVINNKTNYDLTNVEAVQTALDDAKKVLAEAKDGNASSEQVQTAIKNIEDAIAKVKVDTTDLKDAINDVKETEENVYLTQKQEETLKNKMTNAVKKITSDDTKDAPAIKDATELAEKAVKEMEEKLPNKEDGEALNDAVTKADKLKDAVKDGAYGNKVFDNYTPVEKALEKADKSLDAMKKDQIGGENSATLGRTKELINEQTKTLNDALSGLTLDKQNTEKYYNAADKAAKQLDDSNRSEALAKLALFADAAKDTKGGLTEKNYQEVIKEAKKLNETITADQKEELSEAIDTAKKVEGDSNANEKFYETTGYQTMEKDLAKAEKRLEKFGTKFTKPVDYVNNGNSAHTIETKLEGDIKALKVKDWQTSETTNGTITLEKYTGGYTKSTDASKTKNGNVTIEIPGSLKDKQVVLEEQSTSGQTLFPKSTESGTGEVTIEFEENGGRKVQAPASLNGAMSDNKHIGTVDLSGLDTSKTTNLNNLFLNDYYLKHVEGEENLITNKTEKAAAMFCNTNVESLDTGSWDTSNVTTMSRMFNHSNIKTINGIEKWDVQKVSNYNNMFGGTKQLTNLNLSGWFMDQGTRDNTKTMFIDKMGTQKTALTEITLPDLMGGTGQGIYVIEALQDAGKETKLESNVTVNTYRGQKLGTVNTSGNWNGEGSTSNSGSGSSASQSNK